MMVGIFCVAPGLLKNSADVADNKAEVSASLWSIATEAGQTDGRGSSDPLPQHFQVRTRQE